MACLVLLPDPGFTIVEVSDAFLQATNTRRDSLIGYSVLEVFPANPDDPHTTDPDDLRDSLRRALNSKNPDTMTLQRYDIAGPGGFEERYWSAINVPLLASDGTVRYLLFRTEEVTEFVKMAKAEQQFRGRKIGV